MSLHTKNAEYGFQPACKDNILNYMNANTFNKN